jgi:hypothetical protein
LARFDRRYRCNGTLGGRSGQGAAKYVGPVRGTTGEEEGVKRRYETEGRRRERGGRRERKKEEDRFKVSREAPAGRE